MRSEPRRRFATSSSNTGSTSLRTVMICLRSATGSGPIYKECDVRNEERKKNCVAAPLVILCVNSGSSSLKFALYRLSDEEEALLVAGAVERIGLSNGRLWARDASKSVLTEADSDFPDHQTAVRASLSALEGLHLPQPGAVGHRLVHGGPERRAPARVTPDLMQALSQLVTFAPLHLPSEIQGIKAVTANFPHLPQVVCFDTAFHASMPEITQRLPLPQSLWNEGIRRYGFHGLSYEYIVSELGAVAQGRTII